MRASPLILALPALAAAQQIPFLDEIKGFFSKASSSVSSAVQAATDSVPIPDPVAAGAAKIAQLNVDRLTLDNHNELIKPGSPTSAPGLETWLVMVTGANKTCFGLCGRADTAFNESVPLIAASPKPPKLARLDCETDAVLCNAWAVSPPSLLHFQLPQPLADQSTPSSTYRSIKLNRTTVTGAEIAAVHLQDKYLETEPYEGFWHPFDGPLAKAGLDIPFGYAIWGFSQIPSWAVMIGVSMLSRTLMSRRGLGGAQQNAPAGGQAPAPAQ